MRSDGTLTRFETLALQVAPKGLILDQACDELRDYLKDEIMRRLLAKVAARGSTRRRY